MYKALAGKWVCWAPRGAESPALCPRHCERRYGLAFQEDDRSSVLGPVHVPGTFEGSRLDSQTGIPVSEQQFSALAFAQFAGVAPRLPSLNGAGSLPVCPKHHGGFAHRTGKEHHPCDVQNFAGLSSRAGICRLGIPGGAMIAAHSPSLSHGDLGNDTDSENADTRAGRGFRIGPNLPGSLQDVRNMDFAPYRYGAIHYVTNARAHTHTPYGSRPYCMGLCGEPAHAPRCGDGGGESFSYSRISNSAVARRAAQRERAATKRKTKHPDAMGSRVSKWGGWSGEEGSRVPKFQRRCLVFRQGVCVRGRVAVGSRGSAGWLTRGPHQRSLRCAPVLERTRQLQQALDPTVRGQLRARGLQVARLQQHAAG